MGLHVYFRSLANPGRAHYSPNGHAGVPPTDSAQMQTRLIGSSKLRSLW